jgi:hypothetical protein
LINGQEVKETHVEEKLKAKYRVRNWAIYNESLKQRGGQKEYADGAIECLLMVKHVYRLGYRQT